MLIDDGLGLRGRAVAIGFAKCRKERFSKTRKIEPKRDTDLVIQGVRVNEVEKQVKQAVERALDVRDKRRPVKAIMSTFSR